MNKNNIKFLLICLTLVAAAVYSQAQDQTTATTTTNNNTTNSKNKKNAGKKTMKLDFENETVTGTYDTPDASFINSRRMIKYKELFNKRTNFIEEIESNKGLFNEYQK